MITQINEKKEMEVALNHLIFQLRHMRQKYDLMVEEEINTHYEKSKQSFATYETVWEKLMKHTDCIK